MSTPSVLIDGYNLRLESGTGIATYARSLSVSLHQLGHGVDILYGTQGSPDDPLLREIAGRVGQVVNHQRALRGWKAAGPVEKRTAREVLA